MGPAACQNAFQGLRIVEKCIETSTSVIPAKAGIQDVDESITINTWTPAFAGVTKLFFNSLLLLEHHGAFYKGAACRRFCCSKKAIWPGR